MLQKADSFCSFDVLLYLKPFKDWSHNVHSVCENLLKFCKTWPIPVGLLITLLNAGADTGFRKEGGPGNC